MSETTDQGELPDGWARATIREIAASRKGKKPIKVEELPWNGSLPYIDIEAFETGHPRRNADPESSVIVNANDLLVVWDGARSGLVGRSPCKGALGSTLVWLSVPTIEIEFVDHFLKSRFQDLNTNTRGTGIPHVEPDLFWHLEIPLPPLAEQKRIVAKVETLLARVNAAQQRLAKVPALLKRFRQSLLAAACSGQLTEDWRETRNPGLNVAEAITELIRKHEECGSRKARSRKGANAARNEGDAAVGLDLNEMPDLPDTWAYGRAEDIVEPGTVVTYGIVLPGPQVVDGVPYVRGLDIEYGRVLVEQLWRTSPDIAEKHERSRLEPGDVLLCIIRHLKVAIVPQSLQGGNLTQGTVRLRPSRAIMGTYLACYLESTAAQEWMKSRYFGMDMPRINVEDTRAIPVPVPPIEEQHEIMRRVEALLARADRIEKRLTTATRRVETLTQAILAQAFRGELVPTESELARQEGRDYEPADVMLDRIRAARAIEPARKPGRAHRPS